MVDTDVIIRKVHVEVRDEVILLLALWCQGIIPGDIYVVPVVLQANHVPGMGTIVPETSELEGPDPAVDAQVEEDLGVALTDTQLTAEETINCVVAMQVTATA